MSESKIEADSEYASSAVVAIEAAVKEYLTAICPAVLNIPLSVVEAELDSAESTQCLSQFVSGADIMVLFALKLEPEQDGDMRKYSIVF